VLQDAGFIATIRKTRGEDIDAACGQLVGKVNDKTKRQEAWRNMNMRNMRVIPLIQVDASQINSSQVNRS
jgi:hypothetical protein